jgi:diaminohydroxyphosphoribosylaminopyrimidine deaminase/5-amino-6-(5-phosphoribosylamino)uracil reductase
MKLAQAEARRARGSTAPNPMVGAVIVMDGEVVASGYHVRAGEMHAERSALANAGDVRGATMYVTLEPCRHQGRQPPCTEAIVNAGIARVIVGARDPNPITAGEGIASLLRAGIKVDVLNDRESRRLIEDFTVWVTQPRPYVALKMACSLDGAIASRSGERQQLTGEDWADEVRELRIAHDAVMVGAGTIRVDDPLLTVRPAHERARPYRRVVLCETDTVPEKARVFAPVDGYEKTIVVAPRGSRSRFTNLDGVADLVFAGEVTSTQLDVNDALVALRDRDVYSVLCEGGPTLAGRLLAGRAVDRFYWAFAPVFLQNEGAVPVVAGADVSGRRARIDRVERFGDDVLVSGRFDV